MLALGKQVFDEVKAAIAPEAQQVITDNLGSFDKYLTAVIEDAVLHIKNEDPYLTPVSYTHLDVYKRQPSDCGSAARRPGH